MDMSIRRAVAADFARVSEIFRDASMSNEGDRPLFVEHPEFLVFAPTAIDEGRTLVADAGGELLGFVTTVIDGGVCEVEDLFVDPAWMRHGVASRLMAEAAASARAGGTARIEVTANGHALDFYRSAGFVLDQQITMEFGTGYRMHRRIGDGGEVQ